MARAWELYAGAAGRAEQPGGRGPFSCRRRTGAGMLDVNCDCCGRVLIGSRQILSLTSSPAGIEAANVCWCGRPGVMLTGRRAATGREYDPAPAHQE